MILACSRCIWINNGRFCCLWWIHFAGTPVKLRLDFKQLVSEFLQGALSNKMRLCWRAGWHCFCQTTFQGLRPFTIMSLIITRHTVLWLLIMVHLWTTTRALIRRLSCATGRPGGKRRFSPGCSSAGKLDCQCLIQRPSSFPKLTMFWVISPRIRVS